MSRDKRLKANRLGQGAERRAAWVLRLKGYTILERGYRCPQGEIDIIARRGNVVAFIEVKARESYAAALNAVGPVQRGRIERAAQHYIAAHAGLNVCDLRFDVMAIMPYHWPRHVIDAWRP
ncbi:MAG: YraN family protein [Rhodospirillales bacterium]